MSFSLFNVPENFLKKKAVIGTHDYQNSCEHSFKEVAAKEDCKIEPEKLVPEESHPSLAPCCSGECQSESKEVDSDLKGLWCPVWSCDFEPLRTSYLKDQAWNGLYPKSDHLEAGLEESGSDSAESDSSTEELELNFSSQIHIVSDSYMQRAPEGRSEECKKSKGVETESCVINDPSIEPVIAAPPSLVSVPPCSANESTENLLLKGSGKPLLSSCTVGSTKLRSALRGGYEEVGLGPRPSLHVKWAANVHEPPCTSGSHTVPSNHSKHHAKKDHKHRHKGKISNSESRKKVKKVSKSRHIGEAFLLRTHAVTSQKGRCNLREAGLTESLVIPCKDHTVKSIRLNSTVLPQNFSVNGTLQLGERRLVKLDAKLPFSWHVQSHRLII